MQNHPLTESILRRLIGVTIVLLALCIQWGLLVAYGGLPPLWAGVESVLYVGMLALAGYLAWFVGDYLQVWQAKVAFALAVQLVVLANCFLLLASTKMVEGDLFVKSLLLCFLPGILGWVILIQWYALLRRQSVSSADEEAVIEAAEVSALPELLEVIDRVSVKDGSRIHIIPLDELIYIQACGDYVNLFTTSSGQYLKEQTMKYFEQHLPPALFVRIHRSCIVNMTQIMRVELFGKENYQVRLKNGASLKASLAGYKLLKERLGF